MGCERCREQISADLDGELADRDRAGLDEHLASCPACTAFAASAAALHRSQRLAPAAPVPDLTDAILARADAEGVLPVERDPALRGHHAPRVPARRRRRPRSRRGSAPVPAALVLAMQYGLLVVALLMVALAVPDLLATSGDAVHASRHLGGWDVAFAVGLVLAALQPWRARGLLPMAGALAGVMVLTAAIDIARGTTPGLAEGTHLLEVLGLVFLWLLARAFPAGERRRDGVPRPDDGSDLAVRPGAPGAVARLRALPDRFSRGPAVAGRERDRRRPAA